MIQVTRASAENVEATADELANLYHRQPARGERLERVLRDPTSVVLLATLSNDSVGYLHAELVNRLDGELMVLIYDITVAADHRRNGIGTRLMEAALDLAKELGAKRCWLVTEPGNSAARGLYESLDGAEWPAVGFGWNLE